MKRVDRMKRDFLWTIELSSLKLSEQSIKDEKLMLDFNEFTEIELRTHIWSRFNYYLHQNPTNFSNQATLYTAMESFTRKYIKNEDPIRLRKLYHEAKLNDFKIGNLNSSLELSFNICCHSSNPCNICLSDNGKEYEIDYLLANQILPHKECTCEGGCNCFYISNGKRDKKGRLIFI